MKGFATILLALITSIIVITILGTAYSYIWYREKNYVRIKEAYKMFDVMESAATAVRDSWDQAVAAAGPNADPTQIFGKLNPLLADPSCSGAAAGPKTCLAIYGALPSLCYADPDGGIPYCLYPQPAPTAGFVQLDLKIMDPSSSPKIEKWARRKMIFDAYALNFLDYFHDTRKVPTGNSSKSLIALLGEEKAYARTDDVAVPPPNCAVGAPAGCITCGPGAPRNAVCGLLYACPLVFKGCRGYTGTTASPPGGALFVQEFYLSPPATVPPAAAVPSAGW